MPLTVEEVGELAVLLSPLSPPPLEQTSGDAGLPAPALRPFTPAGLGRCKVAGGDVSVVLLQKRADAAAAGTARWRCRRLPLTLFHVFYLLLNNSTFESEREHFLLLPHHFS